MASAGTKHVTVIRPVGGWIPLDLREVWRYRDLFGMMLWRDLTAKYRQSLVGYGWVLLKPIITMVIFTLMVGGIREFKESDAPYALYLFAALLPWGYFSTALSSAISSVAVSGALVSKVYFPRLLLPLTSVCTGLVEVAIQTVMMFALMAYYLQPLAWQVLAFPLFILLAVMTAFGCGLWLTALNVKYRDVGQAAPFFIQAGMWLSPVIYPTSKIPAEWQGIYHLNPLVGIIDGVRWSFLGTTAPQWDSVAISFGVSAVILVTGLFFFRRTETTFADVL